MSAGTDGIVHYDCTRIGLIDALGNLPLGEHLHLEPRGRMADALLAQMPVASSLAAEPDPAARTRRVVVARYEWHEECNGPVCLVCDSCSCEGGCICPDGATYGRQAAEALGYIDRQSEPQP